jgi:ABC-type antimicrobial peptide transport system ATPase subunit
MTEPLLDVDDLHVRFDTRDGPVHAVNGVSLGIEEGEIVGIVDPDDSTEREIGLLMAGESVEQADLEEKDELPGGGEPA